MTRFFLYNNVLLYDLGFAVDRFRVYRFIGLQVLLAGFRTRDAQGTKMLRSEGPAAFFSGAIPRCVQAPPG